MSRRNRFNIWDAVYAHMYFFGAIFVAGEFLVVGIASLSIAFYFFSRVGGHGNILYMELLFLSFGINISCAAGIAFSLLKNFRKGSFPGEEKSPYTLALSVLFILPLVTPIMTIVQSRSATRRH